MHRRKNIRDALTLLSGLGVLFQQIVISHSPSLPILMAGFALVGLPSTFFADRMLSGKAED